MGHYLQKIHGHLKYHHNKIKEKSNKFVYHINFHGKKLYSHGKILLKKADLKDIYKQWYAQVAEVKTQPYEIALGLSLGLFLGILPLFGLHLLLALLLIVFFRINKIAMFLGLALTNPLLTPLIYSASLKIGGAIFNIPSIEISWNLITWGYLKHYLKPFLVGNLILAGVLSFISYFITYYLVKYYKRKFHLETINRKLLSNK